MDSRYTETFNTWNKVAELYQEKFMDLDLYNDTFDFFCNALDKPNSKILEIGCGPGNIAKYILSKQPDFDIFGIDIASNMIALANRNNPKASFAVMDIREIGKIGTKYDGIICGFCLPYLSQKDSEKLILDSKNLLKDDGIFYISFVEGDPDKSGFQITGSGDRSYFYYHTLDQLTAQLYYNKFEVLIIFKVKYKKSETETETEIHTVVIAKK
jgi:SAM-dependent methyltransferase